MRRIILILLVVGLTGGAIWYFGVRTKPSGTENSEGGIFKSFFPIGGNTTPDTENQTSSPTNTTGEQAVAPFSSFKQLTSRAIAGYTVFPITKTIVTPSDTPKGKPTTQIVTDYFVRYVARQSGFVYEIKNELAPLQISNIFIPAIYEALFLDNNTTALLRFLKEDGQTIGSYTVPIPPENPDGSRTQKEGIFLPDNILSAVISPDSKEILRLTNEQAQGVLTTTSSVNKNTKEVLRHPMKEWVISWNQPKTIYLQTKAAGIVEGFLYKMDTTEKKLRRMLGNVKGLTTSISPSGAFVLYSESTTNGFITKIFNTKTGSIKNTNLAILPEKCVWLKNEDLVCAGNSSIPVGVYPDSWYAGLSFFSDQLFHIYTANNVFDVVYDGQDLALDMTALQIDEARNLLFFIDKKTGFLWQFSL